MSFFSDTLLAILPAQRSIKNAEPGGFSIFPTLTLNGKTVSNKEALTLSAFYNGIEIITNDIAKLPKGVFRKVNGSIEHLSDHAVDYLIDNTPNQYMNSFMFHKMMGQLAILKGNGYAEIIRHKKSAAPIALQLVTSQVDVVIYNEKLFYKFDGKVVPSENMIHIPGFSYNGITGVGIVTLAAQSLGFALSAQNYGSEYYSAKGVGSGVIETPKKIDPEAKKRISEAVSGAFNKADNYKIPILDEEMTFKQVRISAEESQFLLSHKHGVEEVARWLNIPPHKLKSLDKATFSNIEHQEIQHAGDSIMPWAIRFEQEYKAKLFTAAERNYYVKFNMNAIMRADMAARGEYYSKMANTGIYTRNEIRALEDMNPLAGLDEPLTPLNTATQSEIQQKIKDKNTDGK